MGGVENWDCERRRERVALHLNVCGVWRNGCGFCLLLNCFFHSFGCFGRERVRMRGMRVV